MTSRDFLPYLGSIFAADFDNGYVASLVLDEVRRPPGWSGDAAQDAFTLIFSEQQGPFRLAQSIYALRHDVLGELDIFLAPLGPANGREYYQAPFVVDR